MKFWENFSSFDKANNAWDQKRLSLQKQKPLQKVFSSPCVKINLSRFQRIKSLFYLIKQDKKFLLSKYFFKNFFKNTCRLLKSYLSKEPYIQKEDLFLFNLNNLTALKKTSLNKNSLFIFGFGYCQKPRHCPKKRFSSDCIYDPKNAICSQCFIGKCANAANNKDIFLVIPDVYFLSKKLLEIQNLNQNKEIVFIISSCELSIKMFSDFANILKIKGLSLKLTNRVCVNLKSFLYAEQGKKNGLTDLANKNKDLLLEILKLRYHS